MISDPSDIIVLNTVLGLYTTLGLRKPYIIWDPESLKTSLGSVSSEMDSGMLEMFFVARQVNLSNIWNEALCYLGQRV